MTRSQEFQSLKSLAREKRAEHGVTTASVSLSVMRDVYRAEGIQLDLCHHKLRKVRAAYLIIEGDPYVLVNATLPKEPRLFAECHELKHHCVDRVEAEQTGLACQDLAWDRAPEREVGAEIFAAEFIYPETEFIDDIQSLGLSKETCSVETIIAAKRAAVPPISYQFMLKRLEWFGIAARGRFKDVQWKKREEEIYGPPTHVRIQQYRAHRAALRRRMLSAARR